VAVSGRDDDFSHWEQNPKAEQFRQFFRPQEIEVEYRV
jgi:hypothetical protein